MSGWQPIETAPKDGTTILIYQPDGQWKSSRPSRREVMSTAYWHQPGNPASEGFWCAAVMYAYRPTRGHGRSRYDVQYSDARTEETMKADRNESRVEKIMQHCVHFTGVQHQHCQAGVAYDEARGSGKLPCLREYADGATCEKGQFPTREEAEKEVAAEEAMWARHSRAHRAAHDDAKAKKLGRGHGGQDSCPCPVCEKGRIYYRVASYNGHMHARCETDGCVSWME